MCLKSFQAFNTQLKAEIEQKNNFIEELEKLAKEVTKIRKDLTNK
jgi:hypothetical protein